MLVVFTIEELSLSSILESFLQADYQYVTVLPSAITFTNTWRLKHCHSVMRENREKLHMYLSPVNIQVILSVESDIVFWPQEPTLSQVSWWLHADCFGWFRRTVSRCWIILNYNNLTRETSLCRGGMASRSMTSLENNAGVSEKPQSLHIYCIVLLRSNIYW
jgi:hypothetical protein